MLLSDKMICVPYLPGLEEPAEDSHEESYCIGAETRRDSQSPANRESHFKLDNGSLQEIEQQQKAKERQAQVLHIYSKLCETQAPAHQPPETTTISKFEDCEFLCLFLVDCSRDVQTSKGGGKIVAFSNSCTQCTL